MPSPLESHFTMTKENREKWSGDVRTVVVAGLPSDMLEREFQNMFLFSRGLECAALGRWCDVRMREEIAPDTWIIENTSTQLIGIATFTSGAAAKLAKETLSGKRVDLKHNCILKAEIGKNTVSSVDLYSVIPAPTNGHSTARSNTFPVGGYQENNGFFAEGTPRWNCFGDPRSDNYFNSPPPIPRDLLNPPDYPGFDVRGSRVANVRHEGANSATAEKPPSRSSSADSLAEKSFDSSEKHSSASSPSSKGSGQSSPSNGVVGTSTSPGLAPVPSTVSDESARNGGRLSLLSSSNGNEMMSFGTDVMTRTLSTGGASRLFLSEQAINKIPQQFDMLSLDQIGSLRRASTPVAHVGNREGMNTPGVFNSSLFALHNSDTLLSRLERTNNGNLGPFQRSHSLGGLSGIPMPLNNAEGGMAVGSGLLERDQVDRTGTPSAPGSCFMTPPGTPGMSGLFGVGSQNMGVSTIGNDNGVNGPFGGLASMTPPPGVNGSTEGHSNSELNRSKENAASGHGEAPAMMSASQLLNHSGEPQKETSLNFTSQQHHISQQLAIQQIQQTKALQNGINPASNSSSQMAPLPFSPSPLALQHQRDQNPPCNTLYVGNLPCTTHPDELEALFSTCRGYKRLCFRMRVNGPMCFVEFEDIACATQALHELYGYPLSSHTKGGIRLSFSKNPLGVRSTPAPAQPFPPSRMGNTASLSQASAYS